MGVLSWIVVAGAAAGGYYCYRRLREIEGEIREEEKMSSSPQDPPGPLSGPSGNGASGEKIARSLSERLLAEVGREPGILQTDLYRLFPGENRRALQDQVRQLVDAGALRRQKEKSTYRVFPGSG